MKFVSKNPSNLKTQKKRKIILNYKNNLMLKKKKNCGEFSLYILNFYILKAKQVNYFITTFNKNRKNSKIKILLNLTRTLTKKPKGTRMGKGVGKFMVPGINLYKGYKLFTFINLRRGKVNFLRVKFEKYFGCKIKLNY